MKKGLIFLVAAALIGAGVWYFVATQETPQEGAPRAQAEGAPGGGALGRASGPAGGAPPLVVAEPVGMDVLYETAEAIGTAQANESITLYAKVTDTVRRVDFEDGDYVTQGDILLQLTNQEEEAQLEEARANLEDVETQLRRLEDLASRGLAPRQDLDVARARAAAAQARMNTVVARLSDRLIQAPFSGVLGFRQVSPGTLVTPQTPITTLDDISIIKLDFTVPELFLGTIAPGAEVLARSASYPEREFAGVVRTVGSRVDPVTRAIAVRALIDNEDGALRPGMLLTVHIIMTERNALVVPENAVFQVQNRAYVYTVGEDMLARQREIRLGARRFGHVEVLEGLEEGELIVTQGIVKLRDGVPVRFPVNETEVTGLPDGSRWEDTDNAKS